MRTHRLLRAAAGLVAFILLAPVGADGSDPFTPPILDDTGQPLRGSITSLEPIVLGEVPQWLAIRGHDVWNPVLLHVDGGLGASNMAWNRQYLAALEKHFIVVNWDQRGAGKSFESRYTDQLTLDRYVNDTIELAQLLSQRFRQDKVYIVTHGVGAIVGALAAQKRPELFHAMVGVAPVTNPSASDQTAYRFALEQAEKAGDAALSSQLAAQGPPPYTGRDLVAEYDTMREAAAKYAEAQYPANAFRTTMQAAIADAPEYAAAEKARLAAARVETYAALYPQLNNVNLVAQVPSSSVPVYFALGRHDYTSCASLGEQYFQRLQAGRKDLVWFEASGRSPAYEEPERFLELMTRVLRDTTTRRDMTE